ncbi:hypothetical protein RvY_10272 [Ramazzottius varieornatus]|uniref:Uncharacterized protein n=1 Tax=Ramazzottius varieornatus TaxID=947166 RepID=A0A1D1VEC0_RAMVA|nr:hypothetical protein RvY_10272 [Ramazzottius varieornatus]
MLSVEKHDATDDIDAEASKSISVMVTMTRKASPAKDTRWTEQQGCCEGGDTALPNVVHMYLVHQKALTLHRNKLQL